MKVNTKALALMAALAAGGAYAATTNTTAGQIITNQASASFTDPSGSNGSVTSNTVQTTVLPKPSFDIVYGDGSADDTTATAPAATYDKTGVLPGATVTTKYTVVNNGNVNNYVVNLAPDSTGGNAPSSVQYFLDANNDGVPDSATPITSVTLPVDNPLTTNVDEGQVHIVQVMTIPTTAASNAQYSASPKGSAPAGVVSVTDPATSVVTTYPYAAQTESQANQPNTNGDLQYTRATVFTPTLTNNPKDGDPSTPGYQTPTTTVVTPPTSTTTIDPNNPTSPPGTPSSPNDPTLPGYTDPPVAGSTGAISITVSGNQQIAYPPADTNTAPDVVNFINTLTTPSGSPADTVNLFPLNPALNVGDPGYGLPYGTNNGDGSFTLPDGTIVKFLNPDSSAPTLVTGPDGNKYPVVNVPAGGGTVSYITQVTYADSNSVADPNPITIVVGADSGNDSDIASNATTIDTIMPPAMQFGDTNGTQTAPNPPTADPTLIGPGNAAQPVVPGASASSGAPSTSATSDSSAVFPMDIANPGEYNDTYTLSGTVSVPLTDGTSQTVKVKYVDASGNELSKNSAGQYITPVVQANKELLVYAIVDIPANAKNTPPGSPLLISQTATSNYSGITLTDNNDQITIGSIGGITVDKYQAVGGTPTQDATGKASKSALPGDILNYAIVAKSTYNGDVKNFVLSDSNSAVTNVYSFSTFQSASVTFTGFPAGAKALYRINGAGSWSATAPATGAVTSGIEVGIDTNNDNVINSNDIVPYNATITLNVSVKVN